MHTWVDRMAVHGTGADRRVQSMHHTTGVLCIYNYSPLAHVIVVVSLKRVRSHVIDHPPTKYARQWTSAPSCGSGAGAFSSGCVEGWQGGWIIRLVPSVSRRRSKPHASSRLYRYLEMRRSPRFYSTYRSLFIGILTVRLVNARAGERWKRALRY